MMIDYLTAVVMPPSSPVSTGSAARWSALQSELGVELPTDFRLFGDIFGSGSIEVPGKIEIFVYQPFSSSYLEKVEIHKANLLAAKYEREADVPYAVFPDTGGLLVWGGDVNGNELYWRTAGDPDAWPVVCRSESGEFQELPGPFTLFLANALAGKVQVDIWPFPILFSPAIARFVPISTPGGSEGDMTPTTIYVLYVQNQNRAGFWAKDVGEQADVIYHIKSIDGLSHGELSGVPVQYKRQPVVADLYVRGKLVDSDSPLAHSHQSTFVRASPPEGFAGND